MAARTVSGCAPNIALSFHHTRMTTSSTSCAARARVRPWIVADAAQDVANPPRRREEQHEERHQPDEACFRHHLDVGVVHAGGVLVGQELGIDRRSEPASQLRVELGVVDDLRRPLPAHPRDRIVDEELEPRGGEHGAVDGGALLEPARRREVLGTEAGTDRDRGDDQQHDAHRREQCVSRGLLGTDHPPEPEDAERGGDGRGRTERPGHQQTGDAGDQHRRPKGNATRDGRVDRRRDQEGGEESGGVGAVRALQPIHEVPAEQGVADRAGDLGEEREFDRAEDPLVVVVIAHGVGHEPHQREGLDEPEPRDQRIGRVAE